VSIENSDKLKLLAERLSTVIDDVKSGKRKLTVDDEAMVDQLDTLVTQYEDIMNKENKMS
jgi:hypothetical protein